MSDMMPGKNPLQGNPQGNPLQDNLSMLNPTDLAVMKQQGNIDQNMRVRDFLSQMGIDVDGPVTQLTEFAQKQTQNATAMGKMKNIAQANPQGRMGSPQGRMPAGPPPEEPSMDNLLGKLG